MKKILITFLFFLIPTAVFGQEHATQNSLSKLGQRIQESLQPASPVNGVDPTEAVQDNLEKLNQPTAQRDEIGEVNDNQEDTEPPEDLGDQETEEGAPAPGVPAKPAEATPEEQEEDLGPEEAPPRPFTPMVEDVIDDMIPEEKPATAGPKKITIDMVIYVDYQFADSPDAFKVKYHLNMSGAANLAAAVIKGDAEIATEVTGFLAKWPEGQCILNVAIAKVPYEIKYTQKGEEEADLSIDFKKDINENWESSCTFIGAGAKPFKTEGPPEKWIGDALKKASPPINSIEATLEAGESSTTTFEISEYTVIEEDLGSAKVKGKGIITIEPLARPATPGSVTGPTGHFIKKQPNQLTPGNAPAAGKTVPLDLLERQKAIREMVQRRAIPQN